MNLTSVHTCSCQSSSHPGFNPFRLNGISHSYQFYPSISILRVVGLYFILIQILIVQTVDPDQMLRSAASGLGLHSLPMSHGVGLYGLV